MTCSETYIQILSDTLTEDYWRFNKTFSYLLTDIFTENSREIDTKNGIEICTETGTRILTEICIDLFDTESNTNTDIDTKTDISIGTQVYSMTKTDKK